LRFIQGMAMGGEWGGAVLMAVEHAPEGGKGFWGSLPQASTGGGLMLASIALGLVSLLPEEALFSWGWRLPFLASIILLAVGWYIRVKEVKVPALQVFKNHPKQLITIILARAAENAWFYIASTFTLAYTTAQLGIARQDILFATICGAAVILFMTPLCGHLSDKVGQRNMFMFGLCILALYCYPFFTMLNTKDPVLVWTAIVLAIGVVFPIMYAPQAQLFARQFPAEIRYSGISISVQLAGVLGGGLAPLIATKLLSIGQGNPYLIMFYIGSMAVVAIISTSFMPRDWSAKMDETYYKKSNLNLKTKIDE